jgi:hypothetical protein
MTIHRSEYESVQAYEPGDIVSIRSDEGEEIAQATILGFDPSATRYYESGRGGGSKSQGPMANHWHIALREPNGNMLPAAIYDRTNVVVPHIHVDHYFAEGYNDRHPESPKPLVISTQELTDRVTAIALQAADIIRFDS